jgi:hypothetical protein
MNMSPSVIEPFRTADDDQQDADQSREDRRSGAHDRRAGDRLGDIAKQLVHAAREDEPLAGLRDIDLHQAHAADRLSESARHFGVDRTALAEERAQSIKCDRHHEAENGEQDERRAGELPVHIKEHAERHDGGQHAPDQLDESGADEITHAFGVGHHA